MQQQITTPFGAGSTAEEVLRGVDLSGRRALVTGGAAGLGRETARVLAAAGATVVIATRDLGAAEAAAGAIGAETGASVTPVRLDLADLGSVHGVVRSWTGPLDVLVANAGIMAGPEVHTPEGRELQFATNHLGHFALATGLHGALSRSGSARVVVVSSVGHTNGPVRFGDLDFSREPYDPWLAYAQSKTANVLFAVEAARRWAADGIAVNALNPGRIWNTGLGRHIATPPDSFDPAGTSGVVEKTVEQGAATSVLLAGSPLVAGVTGRYFEDCQEAEAHVEGVRRGVAAHALDPASAARLWEVSTRLTESSGS